MGVKASGVCYRIALERQAQRMPFEQDQRLMREAIHLMRDAVVVNQAGGAFGSVIAQDDRKVAAAGNSVVQDLDPRAHAR